MKELRIDPELKDLLPPLTDDEFELLRSNILRDKKVIKPLVIWDGIILDGHNRWKIIQENPWLPWVSEEMSFPDKWEAMDWMIDHQRGQRNMSDAQKTYAIAKQYEARKHTHGGDRRSNDFSRVQSGHMKNQRIREQLAQELGVGTGTIMRAQEYARGIDAIRDEDPELASSILAGKQKTDKVDVRGVGRAKEVERPAMIQQIKEGKKVTPVQIPDKIKAEVQTEYHGGGTTEYRKQRQEIAEAVGSLYDDKPIVYTLNNLFDEILWNAESYISLLEGTLESHKDLVNENAEGVKAYISENVTMKIKKIEEEI